LDLVREQEQQPGPVALVVGIDEDGAAAEQVGVLLQDHVGEGEHERVAGVHQYGASEAGRVEGLDGLAGEGDALVAREDRLLLAAGAAGGGSGAPAGGGGGGRDLLTPRPPAGGWGARRVASPGGDST